MVIKKFSTKVGYVMTFIQGLCEHKLTINLSDLAQQVTDEEQMIFHSKTAAEYFNTVFREFHSKSEASIDIAAARYKVKLESYLQEAHIHKDIITEVINVLLSKYKATLKEAQYPRGNNESIRFYIQKDNYDFLCNDSLDSDGFRCTEDTNYSSLRTYYKAVIEEYCRKPFVEREKIYRNKIYSMLQDAIKNKCIVEITLINNKKFYVRGYKIDTDSRSLYNYFVGILANDEISSSPLVSNLATFRISNITQVKVLKSKKYSFSRKEKEYLENQIQSLGIQFLGDKLEKVSIKLTENGIKKYNSMLHLRPDVKEIIDSNIYIFNCTLSQAKFYFFKFGEDALVLEPKTLALEFKEMYIKALAQYNDIDS